MKLRLLIGLLLLFLAFSTSIFGKESLPNEELKLDNLKQSLVTDLKLAKYFRTIKPFLDSIQNKQDDSYISEEGIGNSSEDITTRGPAAPLTYLQVYAAISSNHPTYEYFSENQLSSVEDHGGAEMYIVTVELGYGHNQIAKMNGAYLSSIMEQSIDLDGDSIIDGWYCWWDASGFQSGRFTYENTSINSPWNTMSDAMNIR